MVHDNSSHQEEFVASYEAVMLINLFAEFRGARAAAVSTG